MVHVPYRGSGPMMPELLSGSGARSPSMLPSSSSEHVRAASARPGGGARATRWRRCPDVDVGETVPGFEASGGAASRRPKYVPEIIEQAQPGDQAAFAAPRHQGKRLGATVGAHRAAGIARRIRPIMRPRETQKWAKVTTGVAGIQHRVTTTSSGCK